MKDFLNWKLTNRIHNLGYDGDTLMYIDDEEDIINDDSAVFIRAKPAILISAAFRWFREKYNLYHSIDPLGFNMCLGKVGQLGNLASCNVPNYGTYEEAELACLEELIELVEQKEK